MFRHDIAITVCWLTALFLLRQQVSFSPQLWQHVFYGTQDITSNKGVQFHKSHQTSHLCKHHHFGNHDDCNCHHNLDGSCACADWCFGHLFDKYHTVLLNQMNGWPAKENIVKLQSKFPGHYNHNKNITITKQLSWLTVVIIHSFQDVAF